jgi:hypothetical protein
MNWEFGKYGGEIDEYRDVVGKAEGKRPLRRPCRRWVDKLGSKYGGANIRHRRGIVYLLHKLIEGISQC